jgi:hypothetical protein
MGRWSERNKTAPREVNGVTLKTVHDFEMRPSDVMFMCEDCDVGSMVMRPRMDGTAVDVFFPPDGRCPHVDVVMPSALTLWNAYVARRLSGEPLPVYLESAVACFTAVTSRWADGSGKVSA